MQDRQKIAKQLVDLVKKELLAIMAVGAVLAFLFSQSTATTPATNIPEISSNKMVFIQSSGSSLYNNSPTIRFGHDIKGINNSKEAWTDANAAANFGNSIIATTPTQVTISQVTSGTWTLYLTGTGDITVNGTKYNLGKDKTTTVGTVVISNGTLVIRFGANAQLWEITSTTTTQASISSTQTPTILSIIPASRELKIRTVLTPVPLLQDQLGNVMSQPLIEWSSDNNEVATVGNNGAITALSPGIATIKARISGTNLSATISINVPQAHLQEMPPIFEINVEPENDKINELLSRVVKEATEFVAIDEAVKELIPIQPPTVKAKEEIEEPFIQPKQIPVNIDNIFDKAQTKTLMDDNSLYVPEKAIQEILNTEDALTSTQRLTVKIKLGIKQIASDIKTMFVGSSKTVIDQETNQEIIIKQPSILETIKDFIIQLFTKE